MLTRKTLLALCGICLVCYLPFLSKGLTNDDLVFLDYAKRLTINPTVCVVTDYVFLGTELKDLNVFESTHPPLVPYVIKLGLKLFGENLILLHALMVGFLILATICLADLIARYTRFTPFLALALTLGPMFLPNATGLMTDAALCGFWLAAIVCWDRALAGPFLNRWSLLGMVAAMAAFFTAYQGLGLVFVGLTLALARGKLRFGMGWVILALIPFLLWVGLVWQHYGLLPYFSPPRAEISIANEVDKGLVLENILLKIRALNFYIGAGLFFFLPWLVWRKGRAWLLLASAGWGFTLAAYLFPDEGFWLNLHAGLLAGVGLLALVVLAETAWSTWCEANEARPMLLVLLMSIAGLTVFQVFLASFAAPRYNLISLAALLVFGLRNAKVPRPSLAWAVLVLTVGLGLLVALAEKHYADGQRLDRLNLPKTNIYVAGEKGLHYNGNKLGYHYFLPRLIGEVSYLLVPDEYDHLEVPESVLEKAEVVDTYEINSWLPIRVMSLVDHAGFYIHNRGMLPFVFSTAPIDTLTLYRIYQPGNPNWLAKEYLSKPAGEILPEMPVYEDFVCPSNGLTRISLMMATYNRQNSSTLVVNLFELSAAETLGPSVFEKRLDASTIADNAWLTLDMPALSSKDKHYRLQLSSPDATPNTAVTIWTNSNAEGHFYRGTSQSQGALAFESQCLP